MGISLPATPGLGAPSGFLAGPLVTSHLPPLDGPSASTSDACLRKAGQRGSASNSPAMQKGFSCFKCRAVRRWGGASCGNTQAPWERRCSLQQMPPDAAFGPLDQAHTPRLSFRSSPKQLISPDILLVTCHSPLLATFLPPCFCLCHSVCSAYPNSALLSAQFTCLLTQAAFPDWAQMTHSFSPKPRALFCILHLMNLCHPLPPPRPHAPRPL